MPSNLEYKLLFSLFALALIISIARSREFAIGAYNRSVERARIEEQRKSSGADRIRLVACDFGGRSRAYETIIPFHFFFLLGSFAFAAARTIGTLLFSMLTLAVVVFGYFDWLRETQRIVLGSESFLRDQISLRSYLLFNSNYLDFAVLISVLALLAIEAGLLVRFLAERFRARLDLA